MTGWLPTAEDVGLARAEPIISPTALLPINPKNLSRTLNESIFDWQCYEYQLLSS